MAEIRILHSAHEGSVKLNLNGEAFTLQVPRDNTTTSVPDRFLGVLTDSNIEYEIIATGDGDDEAEAGARGDSGAASAHDPETGPGSLGTVDESSNAAMPATPPVASPQTPAPPEAPAAAVADDDKPVALKEATPPAKPAKAKAPKKAATPKAK